MKWTGETTREKLVSWGWVVVDLAITYVVAWLWWGGN